MKYLLVLALATSCFSGPISKKSTNWSKTKMPGSSKPSSYSPPPSGVKISTASLSRNTAPAPASKPTVIPMPAPKPVVSATPTGKINTSSLSRQPAPVVKPVVAAVAVGAAVATAATPAPQPQPAPQQVVVKKTVVVHHYNQPATVVIRDSRPVYVYRDHYYPVTVRDDGSYYAQVDGQSMNLQNNNGSWAQEQPQVVVAQPVAPQPIAPQPKPQRIVEKPKQEESHFYRNALIILGITVLLVGGFFAFKLLKGDN